MFAEIWMGDGGIVARRAARRFHFGHFWGRRPLPFCRTTVFVTTNGWVAWRVDFLLLFGVANAGAVLVYRLSRRFHRAAPGGAGVGY